MKKIFACCAALSLMLMACGDESSSTAPIALGEELSGTEVSSSGTEGPASSGVPNSSATAQESSAGKPESSSAVVPESGAAGKSSSSVAVLSSATPEPAPTHLMLTDVYGMCDTKKTQNRPAFSLDAGLYAEDLVPDVNTQPVAYRHVGADSIEYTVYITLTCGIVLDSLDLFVEGDTIYAKTFFDRSGAMRCLCSSVIEFKVKKEDAFLNAHVLVLDDENIIPILERSGESGTSEPQLRQSTSSVKAQCNHNTNNATNVVSNAVESEDTSTFVIDVIERAEPAARKYVDEDSMTVVLDNVTMSCGSIVESVDVTAAGDTLVVKINLDPSAPLANCICPTQVSFTIKNEAEFTKASYVNGAFFDPIPLLSGTSGE
jgi:hypothetical protein